jgi:hypothetical protein
MRPPGVEAANLAQGGRMRISLGLLLVLAAVLALVGSAGAKGKTTATIWGASGRTTIDDPARIRLLPYNRPSAAPAPRPAPFYTIDVRLGHDRPAQHVLVLWVPSARRVATVGVMGDLDWLPVAARRARMLDDAVGDLRPYRPGRAWPRTLRSVEQVAALAGAEPAQRSSRAYLVAGAAALLAASALLLARLRRAPTAYPRPV